MCLLYDKKVTKLPYEEEESLNNVHLCWLWHKRCFYVMRPYRSHVKVSGLPPSSTLPSRAKIAHPYLLISLFACGEPTRWHLSIL